MSEWKEDILSKKVDLIHGHQFRDNDFVEDGIPIIKIGQLKVNGQIDLTDCSYIDRKNLEKFKDYLINQGDVLMALTGATLGKTVRVTKDFGNILQNYRVGKFLSIDNSINKDFIYYLLTSSFVQNEMLAKINTAAQGNIGKADFKRIKIRYPSYKIQQKIAHILTTCDTVIEQTQSAIAKFKAIKQGLLHDLFTRGLDANGHLRPSCQDSPELYKESELGMIPKEWEVKIMDHLCDLITDGSHFSPKPLDVGEIIANVKDMDEFGINYEACTKISYKDFVTLKNQNCSPNKGDVLLSKDGTVGRVILFNDENSIVILSSIAILRPNNKLISEFLYGFLKSEYFNKQLLVKLSGSALKRIVLRDIKNLLVAFPMNQNEQRMMSERIIKIENKIQIEETLLQKYQSIKRGLMGDLLGGRKTVGDDGDAIMVRHA